MTSGFWRLPRSGLATLAQVVPGKLTPVEWRYSPPPTRLFYCAPLPLLGTPVASMHVLKSYRSSFEARVPGSG
jgi:hypothetical protein